VEVAVFQPSPIGGSDAREIRLNGSNGVLATVNTERNLRAVFCTGRGGSRRWVFGAERRQSIDSASS